MPPDPALPSTLTGLNYPCLELIFMVPKVFELLEFDCMMDSLSGKRKLADLFVPCVLEMAIKDLKCRIYQQSLLT